MKHQFHIGQRVRISDGSGIDSDKLGRIAPRGRIDGRGVPILPGEYKPIEYTGRFAREWVRLDSGELITMFRSRLLED